MACQQFFNSGVTAPRIDYFHLRFFYTCRFQICDQQSGNFLGIPCSVDNQPDCTFFVVHHFTQHEKTFLLLCSGDGIVGFGIKQLLTH